MFAIATIDKKAVKKIGDAAKYYKQHFNEKNLLVIYGQFEEGKIQLFPMLSYMEIYATKSNFFHLTGLEDTSGNQRFDKKEFFNNAIKYKIASNFDYRDENTELKLEVILKALNYTGNFRMSGDYNHGRPNLETDILVGGQHCCLGFIEDENGYYRPNTVLEADVRNEIIESNQVLAIMQKEPKDKTYTQICYLKNDVYAHKLFREFCTRNPDAPVSQHTINYSTLLPRQQAKEQSKTSNDDIVSEIQAEISQIDKLKLEYETKGRTATVSFSIRGKNDINTPKFAMSNGEYVATATRQITFDIPIPPRKPLKALYIKMRDVVHSIADKFKSKPDNKSSGSGNGSSISKPQTDNNQSKDKKPEQKQDISQTIPSQPSVQTDIPNNSLSEEDKAVRTIIEQATGKKAEEMSPQLFEQLFEQVKELYQENIVNQAKPQHKSEPAPKTAEPKEEPTEHSLTAEKDSYEIDL